MPVFIVGAVNVDLVYRLASLPGPGETVLAGLPEELPGGKGGNQAVAAARLGADVHMIACVGHDLGGKRAVSALRDAGVNTRAVKRRGERTGSAIVLVDHDGENAIVVSPAANRLLEPADVEAVVAGSAGNGVVLMSLEVPIATVETAAAAAAAAGLTVVLNPAPAQELSSALLQSCDVLVPNQHEVDRLGQPDVESLLRAGVGAVVVTRGSAGADIHRAGSTVSRVPAFGVQVVDTTGAGDAFCGGLAWALSGGLDLEKSVVIAAAAGALATRRSGAREGLATLAELDDLLLGTNARVLLPNE